MRAKLATFVVLCVLVQSNYAADTEPRVVKPTKNETQEQRTAKANCNSVYEHRCRNGQCISSESVCDGLVDCIDGSDETVEQCNRDDSPPCNPRTFRCNYGACVDGDAPCNGIKDCADNSDETLPRCGLINQPPTPAPKGCTSSQYKCQNGDCINRDELCDGYIQCYDRSDETFEVCGNFNCPPYSFRCAYGACIDGDRKCDSVIHCADGSDEDRNLCSTYPNPNPTPPTESPNHNNNPFVTPRPTLVPPATRPTPPPTPTNEGCVPPEQPMNGRWLLEKSLCESGRNCLPPDGTRIFSPGTQLVYSCNEGYKLNRSGDVFCGIQGKWSVIPKCIEIRCPPLNSAAREAQCTYEDSWVSCDSSVRPRTTAQLSCRNSYTQDTSDLTLRDNIRCNVRGEWEPKPIKCVSGPVIVNIYTNGYFFTFKEVYHVACPVAKFHLNDRSNRTVNIHLDKSSELDVSADTDMADDIYEAWFL